MLLSPMLVLWSLLGCNPPVDTGQDTDTDTDTDSDTNNPDCSVTDLEFSVEARDNNGVCSDCTQGDVIVTVGLVTNTCDGPVSFTTPDSCLVVQWDLVVQNNPDQQVVPPCTDEETPWVIPKDGFIEVSRDWGVLGVDSYLIQATFAGDVVRADAFNVVP